MRIAILVCGWLSCSTQPIVGQDVNALVAAVRTKLEKVNSYEGLALMKTNVSYLKVPDAQVRVYYQKPDKIKIINEHGISLVPKRSWASL